MKSETSEAPALVGAHLSPGFAALVARLQHVVSSEGKAVTLSFGHPTFPGLQPYRFRDNEGVLQGTITVGDEELVALEGLARGTANAQQLARTSLVPFIQEAGLANGGELIAHVMD